MKPLPVAVEAVRSAPSVQLEANDIAELTTLLPPEKLIELLNHPKFNDLLHKHDHFCIAREAGDNFELDDTSTISGNGILTPTTFTAGPDDRDPLHNFHTRVEAPELVQKTQTKPDDVEISAKSNKSKHLSGWRGWIWLNAVIITILSCFLATAINGSILVVSNIADRHASFPSPEHHQICTDTNVAHLPSSLAARLNNMDLFKVVAYAYPDGWKDHWDNAQRGIDREGLKPLQHIYKHHVDSKGYPQLEDIVKLLNRLEHGQQYSVYELTEALRAWGFRAKSPAARYRGSL